MRDMAEALERGGEDEALRIWSELDTDAYLDAFHTVMGESTEQWSEVLRPPGASGRDKNLRTWITDQLPKHSITNTTGTPADVNDDLAKAAWERSGGVCTSCETPTLSPGQKRAAMAFVESHPDAQRPMYQMRPDTVEVLAVGRIFSYAATVSPEHIRPYSWNGPTTIDNLTGCCAGCNYGRMDSALSALGAPAYSDTEGVDYGESG